MTLFTISTTLCFSFAQEGTYFATKNEHLSIQCKMESKGRKEELSSLKLWERRVYKSELMEKLYQSCFAIAKLPVS